MKKILCIVCLLIYFCADIQIFAQKDIYLKEFTDSTIFNFIGNAQLFNKRIRLTEAKNYQGGAIWLKDKKNVANDFAIEIGFQITDSDPAGADGIAFVIQNTNESIIGQLGGGIGYSGISNALAIEFDTYFNGDRNDPNDNHIAVQSNGRGPISEDHAYTLGIASSIPTMEDGQNHVLRIEYVGKIFKVYLDDMKTPKIIRYVNLDSLLKLDNGMAWLGFTSSTGGSYGNHDITAFGHSNGLIANAGNDTTICLGKSSLLGQEAFGRGPFRYSWFPKTGLSNDTIARPLVKPKSTMMYYVTVEDTFGNMDIDSILVTIDTCSAIIELPDRFAKVLDTVHFPASITPPIDLRSYNRNLYAFTAYLRYPSTMMYPISAKGASITHTFSNNEFHVKVRGIYDPTNLDTLFTLQTIALLGNDSSTIIEIDSIRWEDRQGNEVLLDIVFLPGSCTMTDLCNQGGTRLLYSNTNAMVIQQKQIHDQYYIDIKSPFSGKHIMQFYSVQGNLMHEYSWIHSPHDSKQVILNCSTYPTGMYMVVIKNQMNVQSIPIRFFPE